MIFVERLWQDLSHGVRMLAKSPGFTLVAILSLAIGIGANCAMFSFADGLLLRPLPVARAGEVVTVGTKSTLEGFASFNNSYLDYKDLRDNNRSFESLVAFNGATVGLASKPDALPQMKFGYLVSANLFSVMGVVPELGRGFRPEEDQVPGRDAVMVLDHSFWEQQFHSDPGVLGHTLRLNGIEFTIIGVLPDRFVGLNQFLRPAFYTPNMMGAVLIADDKILKARDYRGFSVKGFLKPGVTLQQSQAELTAFSQGLERTYPATNKNQEILVRTEMQSRFDSDPIDTQLVAMLLMLSGAVLLVACANVASLLTSRAPARAKEIALRLAVGAGRFRLIRQLVTESLLIALAGAVLGVAIGYGGVVLFKQIQIPTDLPIVLPIELNLRVLWFSLAVAVSSVFVFGLIPAIQTTRADLAGAIKTGDSLTAGRTKVWGRSFLVGAQVAGALILLTVSAFLYRGFHRELAAGQGFRTDHLLMMSFDQGLVHYDKQKGQLFYKQLLERSRNVAGVKSVTITSGVPMSNSPDVASVVPEGFQFPKGKDSSTVLASRVDESFFDTMAVKIQSGRGFRETDTDDKPHVAVVNEQFAQHYWPGQDALGKRVRVGDASKPWVEIVGIAKTGKYLWIAEPPTEFIYIPQRQDYRAQMVLVAESQGDAAALAGPLREVVRGIDPGEPIIGVRTMEEFYNMRVVTTANVILETVGGMGLMGLILSTIGLYSLGAYAVSRRTREIGIRMAIGAPSMSVLRMALRQSMFPALCGLAVGLVASFFVERMLKAVFPDHTSVDFSAYLLVVPALLGITALAAFIPARRASKVNPMQALRYE